MKKQQTGFTLIELIMVIVILGILSAFALPRFVDLSGNAEEASLNGGTAAVKSAASIIHAYCLANPADCNAAAGSTVDVTADGTTIAVNESDYPAGNAAGIGAAAALSGFTVSTEAVNGSAVIQLDSNTDCEITYDAANGTATDNDCS